MATPKPRSPSPHPTNQSIPFNSSLKTLLLQFPKLKYFLPFPSPNPKSKLPINKATPKTPNPKSKMALKLPNPLPSPRPRKKSSTTITVSSNSNGSLISAGTPGLRIAYQGSTGAYSEFAAKTACPNSTTLPCRSFSDAISSVQSGLSDRAILPVESTMEGTALRNYHLLLQHDLLIVQEINLFVHYCLLAMPGVQPTQLRKVISHPMALAHCGRALSQLGIHRREPVEDTAGAVEMLRSHQLLDTAAIASPRTALIYGLDVVAHGIQDENWNVTRFLLLSKMQELMPNWYKTPVKTSMVVAHRGGSMMVLLKVLSAFSKRNINLTKLEVNNPKMEGEEGPVMILDVRGLSSMLRSFPHVLYVDFEGSVEEENVREAIEEIEGFSVFVRILGCYPADKNVYDLH